jgi:outer membrane protein OmpA-like peptidoglycan-associated protein
MKTLAAFFLFIVFAVPAFAQNEERDSFTVYFNFDKHEIRPEERAKLDDLISLGFLTKSITTGVIIKAYCDIRGSVSYNDELAKRRAFSVHEYLLNHGVAKTSVAQVTSFGERMPVNDNRTEEERQLNRKVVISWPRVYELDTPVSKTPPEETALEPLKPPVRDFSKNIIDTIQTGEVLRLRNINFYGGRHTFLPSAEPALQELLEVMKSHPTLVIDIQGHICCRPGSPIDGADFDSGDNNLSFNRAWAVFKYLLDNGIDKKRMTYHGFAGSKPLVDPELTEDDRTANRRVEIQIISK